jgi:hypothetical protein
MSTDRPRDYDAFVALLDARMRAPFAWGRRANDCVSFAGAAVLAQTGEDLLADLPDWTTAIGATRALKRVGGLVAAVDARLSPVPNALAQRGDVALIDARTLMIIEGPTLVGPGASGLVRRPRADMIRAWSAV